VHRYIIKNHALLEYMDIIQFYNEIYKSPNPNHNYQSIMSLSPNLNGRLGIMDHININLNCLDSFNKILFYI